MNSISLGNCIELIRQLEPGSFDCVITDPAYWTLNKWREVGTTTRLGGHYKEEERDNEKWFETIGPGELWVLIEELQIRMPKNSHCWIMCDHETLRYIQNCAKLIGFTYCKPYPCIKMTQDGASIRQGMGYHGRCSHEYVVLLEKGRRKFSDENWPDVFMHPWVGDKETKPFTKNGKPFPTAKPLSLMERLLELSTDEGEVVLDPFTGSGTTVVAAKNLNRGYIGWDINPEALEITNRRLNAS